MSTWNGPHGKLDRFCDSNFQTKLSPSFDSEKRVCAAAVRQISRDCKREICNGGRDDTIVGDNKGPSDALFRARRYHWIDGSICFEVALEFHLFESVCAYPYGIERYLIMLRIGITCAHIRRDFEDHTRNVSALT